MLYEQIIDNCFEDKIGCNGLNKTDFGRNLEKAENVLNKLKREKELDNFAIFNHIEQGEDFSQIIQIGEEIKDKFDKLVVLGTGGSTLTPQSMICLSPSDNETCKEVVFLDSVDPFTINSFIEHLEIERTGFLVSSKSGKTVETLALFISVLNLLEEKNIDLGKHIYIISDPVQNPLREIGEGIGATILDHVHDIGGRFSTFTNVGLIPAVVAGINVKNIRKYAKEASLLFFQNNSIPVLGAAMQYSFMQKGINISVMMPYIDRLSAFTTWYRQVWAESLGKNGKGSTPIKARGALDQHSQLQLYLDGPEDKIFNLITCDSGQTGPKLSSKYLNSGTNFFNGKYLGDVKTALKHATTETLVKNNRPVRNIKVGDMGEEVLSKITVHFMLETIITANLLELNPFDQPAVEDGKVLCIKKLSKI